MVTFTIFYHQYTPNVGIYIPYMDPMGMAAVSFRKLIGGQISSEASLLPGLCGGAGKPTGHQSCNRSGEFPSFSEFGTQSLMDLIDRNRFNWHMKTTWPENTGYIVIWICIYIILYITLYIGYNILLHSMDMIQWYPMTLDWLAAAAGPRPVRPVSSVGGAVAWGCKYCLDE